MRLIACAALLVLAACGRGQVFYDAPTSPPTQVTTAPPKVDACALVVLPDPVDFGSVGAGQVGGKPVTFSNRGSVACHLSGVAVSSGSDPAFFDSTRLPLPSATIDPGANLAVSVGFAPRDASPPYTRTGTLLFASDDPKHPTGALPLIAEVSRCALGIVPSVLDFGNILLNGTATDHILLFNDGGLDCDVSGIALVSGTDADFSLPVTQATSLVVPAGGQSSIAVTFQDLSGAAEPFLRQGLLSLVTGDPTNPDAQVQLLAFVNTACLAASQWIYTVDGNGTFSQFDPQSLTFTDIGSLSCPNSQGGPFSMAVDQNANAWVVYQSSGFSGLFEVSTSDASCQATSYSPPPGEDFTFGMSFLFDANTGVDTLYVALTDSPADTLATISMPGLQLSTIGATNLGSGELAGTGDGELWDFVPVSNRTDGFADAGALLARLDPATGAAVETRNYPGIQGSGGSFCMKFWGGAFWVFLDGNVERIDRNTGEWSEVITNSGRNIVGAGVSTCAPVQQQ